MRVLNLGSLNIYYAGCIGSDGEILKRQLLEADVNTKFIRNLKDVNGHAIIQVNQGVEQAFYRA